MGSARSVQRQESLARATRGAAGPRTTETTTRASPRRSAICRRRWRETALRLPRTPQVSGHLCGTKMGTGASTIPSGISSTPLRTVPVARRNPLRCARSARQGISCNPILVSACRAWARHAGGDLSSAPRARLPWSVTTAPTRTSAVTLLYPSHAQGQTKLKQAALVRTTRTRFL